MNQFFDFVKRAFVPGEPVEPLKPGMYHYQAPAEDPLNYRLHLRIEPGGEGLLVINASTVLHLNQTATEYAYHLVNQTPEEEIIQTINNRYRVEKDKIEADFSNLREQIDALIILPDLDPVTYLDMDRQTPYTESISAPYRLDCALTYRLPATTSPEAAPVKRVDRELSTDEWKQILTKAWKAGIPQIIFTGGEPTLRDDLPELIAYAEETGQVTGILTDGLKLGDSAYLHELLNAGLDHTMIVLQPDQEKSWESLSSFSYWSETMDEDLFVVVHLTLTDQNKSNFNQLIEKLAEAGVSAISLSTNSRELGDQMKNAQDFIYENDLELIWDIPVPYSALNPIALELENQDEIEIISGTGKGWLYIEPDGDVLPGQGINKVIGNILEDDWDVIWNAAKQFLQDQ